MSIHARRYVAVCLLLLSAMLATPAQAHDRSTAGAVVFQLVGRNQVESLTGPGSGTASTLAYFVSIRGLPEPLFGNSGAISEANAFFTLRSESYSFSTIDNGNTKVRFRSPNTLVKVFYNRQPWGDFTQPDSLSSGSLIATFRVTSTMASKVDNVVFDVTSSELVSSADFVFRGRTYNFKRIARNGVTMSSLSAATPAGTEGILATQIPWNGVATAIGEADR
jgi:hypothetical protein